MSRALCRGVAASSADVPADQVSDRVTAVLEIDIQDGRVGYGRLGLGALAATARDTERQDHAELEASHPRKVITLPTIESPHLAQDGGGGAGPNAGLTSLGCRFPLHVGIQLFRDVSSAPEERAKMRSQV